MKKLPNPIDFGKKIAKALKFAFGPSSRVSHYDEKDEYPKIGDLEVINVDKLIGGINS